VLPVNRYQSVELYSISGYNPHRNHDFQAFASRGNIGGTAATEPLQLREPGHGSPLIFGSIEAVHWTLVSFTIANVCGK
jgi:hypothetical protein